MLKIIVFWGNLAYTCENRNNNTDVLPCRGFIQCVDEMLWPVTSAVWHTHTRQHKPLVGAAFLIIEQNPKLYQSRVGGHIQIDANLSMAFIVGKVSLGYVVRGTEG